MINYLSSLILPAWLLFVWNNFWVIVTCTTVGYFIGQEGGIWSAIKRFVVIITIATALVATGALVKENLPDWVKSAKAADDERQASKGWSWSYKGGDKP